MSEGAFEIRLSQADLVAAFRLNASLRKIRPLIIAALVLSVLLAAILILSPAARASATSRPLTLLLEGALALALLLVVSLALALRPIWRTMARRALAQRADLSGPIRYAFSGEGLRHETVHSVSTPPWSALFGWREDDRILLIYPGPGIFYPIPKAQLPAETLGALRDALLAGGVKPR